MLPLIAPTICMSLVAGALAVTSVSYVLEGKSYPNTPNATHSVPCRIACSAKCTALEEWPCGGFRYLANGTCQLYKAGCIVTTGMPPEKNSTYEQPAIHRVTAPSGCPGNATDPCACPDGFTRCAGHCLHLLTQMVNYTEAEAASAALGAHLATPRSEEQNQCAVDVAASAGYRWMGIRGGSTEGSSAVGADGCGAVAYSNWYSQEFQPQPDACVDLSGNGRWGVYSCSNKQPALCQLDDCYRPDCGQE